MTIRITVYSRYGKLGPAIKIDETQDPYLHQPITSTVLKWFDHFFQLHSMSVELKVQEVRSVYSDGFVTNKIKSIYQIHHDGKLTSNSKLYRRLIRCAYDVGIAFSARRRLPKMIPDSQATSLLFEMASEKSPKWMDRDKSLEHLDTLCQEYFLVPAYVVYPWYADC